MARAGLSGDHFRYSDVGLRLSLVTVLRAIKPELYAAVGLRLPSTKLTRSKGTAQHRNDERRAPTLRAVLNYKDVSPGARRRSEEYSLAQPGQP